MIKALLDHNVRGLSAEMLPAARPHVRSRPNDGEPLRVLFLQSNDLGATSTSRLFERMAATCDGIESVHINMRTEVLSRLAGAQGYLQGWRMAEAWAIHMSRWFDGPLRLDRFDVVLVMRQQRALALARARRRKGDGVPPYVIDIDATTIGSRRSFGLRHDWPDLDAWVGRRAFADAGGIGCHSRWAADSVLNDYAIDPAKVFLYFPSTSAPLSETAARARSARLANLGALARGEKGERLRLVFVGHDWERKGGHRLLGWHQERWKDRVELHVCSGKAPRDESAVNVFWHGGVDNKRLVGEVLPSMDLTVLPTVNDASPIALHEAVACGVAQIGSRLAGIPEIIEDGVTGLLCDPRDDRAFIAAVERLLNDPTMLVRMAEASLRKTDHKLSAAGWFAHLVRNLRAAALGQPMVAEPAGLADPGGGGGGGGAPAVD